MSESNTMTLEPMVIAKTFTFVYVVGGGFRLHVKTMAV